MRKLTKGIIIGLSVLLLGVIIYFYFPKVWGGVLYPLAYEDIIQKYAKENNISPYLVAAVIFQESHYNPEATSRVGARGLMQIMPATGNAIAQRMGYQGYTPDKLYDPETNIRFGSFYLKELLDQYHGNTEVALAAYNGGAGVADRYLASRAAPVPTETAGFIRSVTNAQQKYEEVYSKELTPQNVKSKLFKQAQPPSLWDRFQQGFWGLFQ